MSIITPRAMAGTLELLPRQQVAFQRLVATIRAGFERFGFLPIETPTMERTEVLLSKGGGDTEKQVYFALSTGALQQGKEPELALSFDLTVPLARYVAEHEGRLSFPFRRYQIQRVCRGERAQRGRYREFYQCDIDVIGKDQLDLRFDAEVPGAIIAIFRELDIGPFTVCISNRKLLGGLLNELGIDPARRPEVLREIDKVDKLGAEHLTDALGSDGLGLSADQVERIVEFIAIEGSARDVLERLDGLGLEEPIYQVGRSELERVIECLEALSVSEENYRVELAIVRGLDYYTSTVYETFLDEQRSLGSICSGGRYDDLASHYTRSQLPGVGMSIGLTRLFSQLIESGRLGAGEAVASVLVTQQDPAFFSEYLGIATRLREAGINTEVVLEDWRFKKQMKYANGSGIPLVVIMGNKEYDAGLVAVKDMASGEQHDVPLDGLAERVRSLIAQGS